MKVDIIPLIISTASVGAFLSYGAPMDPPSNPHSLAPLPTEKTDQVQQISTSLLDGVHEKPEPSSVELLIAKEAAQFAEMTSEDRKEFRERAQWPEFHFGSEDTFVKKSKYCNWLRKNPDEKKTLQAIYVTSEVFMDCNFSPKEFPALRNVNIKLFNNNKSLKPSRFYYSLLNDPGFIALKNGGWGTGNDLKLKIYPKEHENVYDGLEWHALRDDKAAAWLPFLLEHRVWESMKDPFAFWENFVDAAMSSSDASVIAFLSAFAKSRPFLQKGDPIFLEDLVRKGSAYYEPFRGQVDNGFLDALLATRSGDEQVISTWLSGEPTSSQICRVLHFQLVYGGNPSKKGRGEIAKMLASDPRLDVNCRNHKGSTLVNNAAINMRWKALDILLSRSAIDMTNPRKFYDLILQDAIRNGMPLELFNRLLDAGVSTFVDNMFELSPLSIAAEMGKRRFFDAILAKRIVKNALGVSEVQLTKREKVFLEGSEETRQWLGNHPILIVFDD